MNLESLLKDIYDRLLTAYGPQGWWPADGPFEVMIGAVLTQNTSWRNVEQALASLSSIAELTPGSILGLGEEELASAIRSSGYFRQKAERVRLFCTYLVADYGGHVGAMDDRSTADLRRELLDLKGIGPETADSILLYALNRPVFVVDAYTTRLLLRLGLVKEGAGYQDTQMMFMDSLAPDSGLFNEYHALIVAHGKQRCRKSAPLCRQCPLETICVYGQREA